MAKSPKRTIEFAEDAPVRFKDVPLAFPLLVDGARIETVTVNRMRAEKVKELQDAMDGGTFSFDAMIPQFVNQPADVMAALDADDYFSVTETVMDFLPGPLKAAFQAASDQLLDAEPSSQTSPSPLNGDAPNS